MKKPIILTMTLSALLVTSCGTMERVDKLGTGFKKSDCATSDWEKLGYESGKAETSTEKERALAEYCPDEGYSFDAIDYNKGYERGLTEICTTDLALKRAGTIFVYSTPCSTVEVYTNTTKNAPEIFDAEINKRIDAYILRVEDLNALSDKMRLMDGASTEYQNSKKIHSEKSKSISRDYQALRDYIKSNNLSYDLLDRTPLIKGMPVK